MGMPEEKKENRTWPIIGTILAILLCGCPGLTMCAFGVYAATGTIPDTSYSFGNSGYVPSWIGFGTLCVALIFIAIAIVVPILLLRKKKPAAEAAPVEVPPPPPQEPLPPAS
jgi:hypothetical protein